MPLFRNAGIRRCQPVLFFFHIAIRLDMNDDIIDFGHGILDGRFDCKRNVMSLCNSHVGINLNIQISYEH